MAKASVDVFINGNLAKASLRDLKLEASKLRNELARLEPTSSDFVEKSKKLQNVTGQIDKINTSLKGSKGLFSSISKEIKAFGTVAIAAFGFEMITSQISNLIQKNAKLSDSMADIQKTTGLTALEVNELNSELGKLNTRTATADLREMAVVAGQLGVEGKSNIIGFVSSMDKLNVALGDEFGGKADELATKIGGLRNVLTDIKSDNIGKDLLFIGNALNQLSAKGAATAPVVQDFANRIGGVGISLGLSSGQVLGLSATLQELNITAERGGTATIKLLQKMVSNSDAFASIAGVSVDKFRKMLDTDLYGAFVKVAEGSTKTGGAATKLIQLLEDAELSGAGVTEIFSKLGSNTKLLTEKVNLATESLTSNNSILNEFNIKNETLAAKLERVQKALLGAFSNPTVTKWVENIVSLLDDWTKTDVSSTIENERIQLLLLEQKLYDVNVKGEDRIKLINNLKSQYPGYLQNIDAEKASNAELSASIDTVNRSLIDKIKLQKQGEKIATILKPIAEFEGYQADRTIARDAKLAKARKEYNLKLAEGLSLEEQSKQLYEQLKKLPDTNNAEKDNERKRLIASLWQDQFVIDNWKNRAQNLRNTELKAALDQMKIYEEAFNKAFGKMENAQPNNDINKKTGTYNSLKDEKNAEKAAAKKAKAEAKALKDSERQVQKYLDDIRSIEDNAVNHYNASIVDKFDRERALAATATDREIENNRRRIKDRNLLTKIEKDAFDSLQRKIEAINKEEKEFHEQQQKELMQQLDTEIANENAIAVVKAEKRVIEANSFEDELKASAELHGAKTKQLFDEYAIKLQAAEGDASAQKLIYEQFLKDKAELDKAYFDNYKAKNADTKKAEIDAAVQTANDIANVWFMVLDALDNARQAAYNNQLARNNAEKKVELTTLKYKLDHKKISEEQFNAEKARIEKVYALKQYEMDVKLFEQRKRMAITEALIKGALLAMQLSIEYTPLLGIPLAIGITAAQVAVIDSQAPPEAPQFASGGATMALPGITGQGGSIATGGIVTKPYYALVGEKGAEYIIPNYLLQDPMVADSVRMIESLRTGRTSRAKGFADGGSTAKNAVNTNSVFNEAAIVSELQALRAELKNNLNKEVILSYQQLANFLDNALESRYPNGIKVVNNNLKPRIFGTT